MRAFMTAMSKGSAVVLSMLLLFTSNSALAAVTKHTYIGTQKVVIQKPVLNNSIIGEALTGWINTSLQQVVDSQGTIYGSFGLTINSPASDISYSESGKSYTVYNVYLPGGESSGIGFVLRTYSQECGVIIFVPFCKTYGPHIQTGNDYNRFEDGTHANVNLAYSYEIKFIAVSQNIEVGSYNLGGSDIGHGSFFSVGRHTASVGLGAFILEYKQRGCTASLSPAVINMGVVSPLLFTGVGSTVASNAPVTVSLQCSTPDIGVLVTMTDQNNSSNSTNKLQLTPGTASATGVGVQFLKDGGSPVIYGPDSSFVDSSSAAQWRVKDKATLSNTAQFVLTPQYIQTASSITAGEANAVASITFAYD
ncbi:MULTISPECIES: fimbrial protein [Pseudomonas]|uniref:fimbrial protein n=1 Tax=Pseudomonas TaxID=286 RepID=UPI000AAD01EE|nr:MULTISPECIES: fimbrial protein [Pseudomonas]MBJ2260363.1 fimbrial protein [Pseudomonas sp. MF6787]MDI3205485.1 fimbrial protein [Pseudomonas shahriarae]WLI37166.1 fimbrial protein [Pseudomonas sp. FP818]